MKIALLIVGAVLASLVIVLIFFSGLFKASSDGQRLGREVQSLDGEKG